jgi:hypothetical protein
MKLDIQTIIDHDNRISELEAQNKERGEILIKLLSDKKTQQEKSFTLSQIKEAFIASSAIRDNMTFFINKLTHP